MSIYRVVKDKENPYVILNKSFLGDDRLSWKAKGLLAYLLSKPDDWRVMEADLIKQSTDGRDSVRNAIKELIACGYVVREQKHNDDGTFGQARYDVFETPVEPDGDDTPPTNPPSNDPAPRTENPSSAPKTENTSTVKTSSEKSTTAKRPLLNKDLTNKRGVQNNEYTKGTRNRNLDQLIPTKTKQRASTTASATTSPTQDPRYSAFYALYPDA